MKVVATKTGFDGKRIRTAGETFEMPDGSRGSWFEPVKAEKEGPKPKEPKSPASDLV